MENSTEMQDRISLKTMLMVVLWPGFLVASVATGVFFSLFDPMELIIFDERIQVPMIGAYTIGFLSFWVLGAMSSLLTIFLIQKTK